MYIEELKGDGGGGGGGEEVEVWRGSDGRVVVGLDLKRVLIGAGARALFYPTLAYNVIRNRLQAEFRWWDKVDEFVLLGAVPFPTDVPHLKAVGVRGVITLNEPYETLVPTSLYQSNDISHLVIPTRDYCFAPVLNDICRAVHFINENASNGTTTYVHCKAGRGRSTTIVICYLVRYKQMTPESAYEYLKSIRPRVLLASAQWQAVQEYYCFVVKKAVVCRNLTNLILNPPSSAPSYDLPVFDESSVVVVTESDLEGYDATLQSGVVGNEIWADLSVVYRVRVAGQAALTRISCLWFRCHTQKQISAEKLGRESSCSITADHLGGISVDIQVY